MKTLVKTITFVFIVAILTGTMVRASLNDPPDNASVTINPGYNGTIIQVDPIGPIRPITPITPFDPGDTWGEDPDTSIVWDWDTACYHCTYSAGGGILPYYEWYDYECSDRDPSYSNASCNKVKNLCRAPCGDPNGGANIEPT